MSSILSTQNRHIFLRRKYCFLPIAALSPPVGREEPLIGLPPLVSAITTPSPQWIRELLRAALRGPRDLVWLRQVPPEGPAWLGPRLLEWPALPSVAVRGGGRRAFHELSCACRFSSVSRRCGR